MSKTYITFGSAHIANARKLGVPASTDGWVEIDGCTNAQARGIIVGLLGDKWAFDYTEENWDPKWYQDGCVMRVTVADLVSVSCVGCGKTAADLVSASELEAEVYSDANEWARADGTYGSTSNKFCCDSCYIKAGMPLGTVDDNPAYTSR